MKTKNAKQDAYEKPAMRVIPMRENLLLLKQTSYHYMGGPDD
ncbi:hypothetical protein SAMN04487827_1483 [Prevotella sp. khp7]|nr:hypothetical protein SAMN04487827_1483 [Prevotella sp. khp7]